MPVKFRWFVMIAEVSYLDGCLRLAGLVSFQIGS